MPWTGSSLVQVMAWCWVKTLQWRHNDHDGVPNHQPHDCLLNRLFRRRSKKTWKLRVTGLCAGNSPGTDEFPAQKASNAENVSIWWRHHDIAHFVQAPVYWRWALLHNISNLNLLTTNIHYNDLLSHFSKQLLCCYLYFQHHITYGVLTLRQMYVVICCLATQSLYLNQCWILIKGILWHSHEK